jgi:ParB family chromosome partitioning protein
MIKKRGLGKGIGALIPDFDDSILDKKGPQGQKDLFFAPIDEIITNPNQPRKIFSEEAIKELSLSIKEKGVLQPLLVKKAKKGYELIAGERRLRASHKAGLLVVPVILKDVDEKTSQEIALIENIQRKDLNVLEEAEAYQSLINRYSYTQEDVSKKLGKNRTVITNALRLLKLSESIKKDLLQDKISMGHARAYLGVESSSVQHEVHKKVIKKGLSVRQTETLIKKLKTEGLVKKEKKKQSTEEIQNEFLLNELQKKFSTKVNITKKGKKGQIIIEYYSDEDLNRIYEVLRGS